MSGRLGSLSICVLNCVNDFIETVTLTGQRQYVLATVHHAGRRVRVLGTTAHPTRTWVTQTVRNLLMDLDYAGTSRGSGSSFGTATPNTLRYSTRSSATRRSVRGL